MNYNSILVAIATLMLLLPSAMGGVITEDVEVRGEIMGGDGTYNYINFGAFWYDLDDDIASESISIALTGRDISEGDLVYTCVPQPMVYENPDLDSMYGSYDIIGFMAEEYMCYDGASSELVKILVEWGDSDDIILSMDDPLYMPEGYMLVAQEIDLTGDKCVVALYRDGTLLDTEIVIGGNTYTYEDDDDVLLFSARMESVFRGTDSNLVVVKYLFLRSDDILDIDGGDTFGEMEVVSTSGGITLENDGAMTLDAGTDVDIMDGLYFVVADSTSLRYYLAKTISLECPECPACPECPTIEPCPPYPEQTPCPIMTPEVITEYVNVSVPAEESTLPVYQNIAFVCGLVALIGILLLYMAFTKR